MTQIDLNTVRAMAEAGIEFAAQVPAPWGGETLVLRPEQVTEFVADSQAFYAKSQGASEEEYLDRVATHGTPRCGVTTASGKRCRNVVAGGIQRSFPDWLQGDGGFCTTHGGACTREAREARRR